MPSAFVMISCDFGSTTEVASELRYIIGVEQVWAVSGMSDIILRINVQSKEHLDRINLHIRRMDKIQSTMTLIVLQSQRQIDG